MEKQWLGDGAGEGMTKVACARGVCKGVEQWKRESGAWRKAEQGMCEIGDWRKVEQWKWAAGDCWKAERRMCVGGDWRKAVQRIGAACLWEIKGDPSWRGGRSCMISGRGKSGKG